MIAGQSLLVRNTFLYLPAQILGPAAQFVAILAFTAWMAPASYGLFTYVVAGQDFVFLLSLYWWSQYTVRYLSGHELQEDARYRRSELSIVTATIALQIVASVLILGLVAASVTPNLVAATILYIVSRSLNLHLGERARARNQIFDYSIAQSAGPIAGFILAYVAITLVEPSAEAALYGYAVAQIGTQFVLMVRQDIDFAFHKPDPNLLRGALTFGLPLIVAAVAVWCGMNAIRIVVDHRLGTAVMGLIAVGWGLGNRLTSTAAMLVTAAAYPLAVATLREGSRDRAMAQITDNGVLMFGILLPAGIGLTLVQEPFVALFVAEPYRAMTLVVLPAALAAGIFRNLRTHVVDQIFMLVERTGIVCAMSVAESLAAIAGCFVGADLDGAAGAAMGTAAGYAIALVAGFAFAIVSARVAMPWASIARVTAAAAAMVVVLLLLRGRIESAPLILVVQIATGVLVYALALALLFPPLRRMAVARMAIG